MAQVSIGQVENLEDLVLALHSVRETLRSACGQQMAAAEHTHQVAREEVRHSEGMLDGAMQQELVATHAAEDARQVLDGRRRALASSRSSLAFCLDQRGREDEDCADCSEEYSSVAEEDAAVDHAEGALTQASTALMLGRENRQSMERRVDLVRQAQAMAEQTLLQAHRECHARLASVDQSAAIGATRLRAAQQALDDYLAATPAAAAFHVWLTWNPAHHRAPITPDMLRDRINLSAEHQRILQHYLYDRNPAYRKQVEKYRVQWATAQGDAERNIVARKARTHLSGEFGEQIVRHALAPLGGRIETQGRTLVGDGGRYTKTDLLVTDLRAPVILGRGEGMAAPVGGSMAFEVKCGKAEYLFAQRDHMIFQADGHKQADAQCTLCSRDIHDLSPEKQAVLRDSLRAAGSPMVGMLPRKNDIDQSCLAFIFQSQEERL